MQRTKNSYKKWVIITRRKAHKLQCLHIHSRNNVIYLTIISENFASLNPIKKQAITLQKKWESIEQQLQAIMKPFKQSLQLLLENINDENKYYKVLSLMRKNQLLCDIPESINEKIIKENFSMKKQIQKLKLTLSHLSKTQRQIRNSSKSKQNSTTSHLGSIVDRIDATRTMPQNIYIQARLMNQKDFIEWCDKILMKNKIVITEVKRDLSPKKSMAKTQTLMNSHKRFSSQFFQKQVQKDYPSFYQKYSSLIKKIQQLSPLLQIKSFQNLKSDIINQIQSIKLQKLTCPKFCCSLQNQKLFSQSFSVSRNFSKSERNKSQKHGDKDIYRDNKMQEYFRRYYKHPQFKVGQIKSVEHTRAQQMNRLENQYIRMNQHRSKARYGY